MKVPQAVKDLPTDGRRLAWGLTSDGTALVATPTSLYAGSMSLPWTDIERVSWVPSTLTVTEVSQIEGTGARHSWELAQDGRLAEAVRAQVTSSIGWSDRRSLHPAGHVRVVGRRVPGADALLWQLAFAPGTDADDPALRAQAEQIVAELRRTIG